MTLSLQPLFIFLRWLICVRNRLSSSRLDKCFHQARIHRSPPGALAFFSNSILAIFSLRPETQNACCPLVLVFWMQVTTSAGDGSWTGWFKLQCGKTDHSFSTSTVGPWRQKWLVIRKFSKYGFASKLSKQKPSSFFGDVWALIFKLPWQFHPGEKKCLPCMGMSHIRNTRKKSTTLLMIFHHFGVCRMPHFQIHPNIMFGFVMLIIIIPEISPCTKPPLLFKVKPSILLVKPNVWCLNLNVDLMLLLHPNWCFSRLKSQFWWFNPKFDG